MSRTILLSLGAALALLPTSGFAGRCSGGAICTACTTCQYCGNCAGGGGNCSVCAPDLYRVHPAKQRLKRLYTHRPRGRHHRARPR
jgi:hypothetical protein